MFLQHNCNSFLFSHGVRQCVQNPPARYFLKSENVLGKFRHKKKTVTATKQRAWPGVSGTANPCGSAAGRKRGRSGGGEKKLGLGVWGWFKGVPVSNVSSVSSDPSGHAASKAHAAARSAAQTPDAPGAAGNAALLLARAVYLYLSKPRSWKIIKEPTHTHSAFNRHLLMNIPSPDPAALQGLQLKSFYPHLHRGEAAPLPQLRGLGALLTP